MTFICPTEPNKSKFTSISNEWSIYLLATHATSPSHAKDVKFEDSVIMYECIDSIFNTHPAKLIFIRFPSFFFRNNGWIRWITPAAHGSQPIHERTFSAVNKFITLIFVNLVSLESSVTRTRLSNSHKASRVKSRILNLESWVLERYDCNRQNRS